jgi:transcriptional regulator with GAF, ATPase, and Fis domain
MNPRIVGIAGPFRGDVLPLRDGDVSIGRESSNDLCITDAALSRRHCLLMPKSEQFAIRDLGSRNGTRVNGVPVDEHLLSHGDQIAIGSSLLVFLLGEDALHLERNPIELTETAEIGKSALLLRPEDAFYGRPDRGIATLPQTARVASDLSALLKIATGIGGIRDQDSLQWQLLGMIFDLVPAERGAVLLFDRTGGEFSSAVAWDRVRGPGHPVRVSRTVVQRVGRDRVGVVVNDVSGDEVFNQIPTLAELSVSSLLCVPLVVSGTAVGAIYLDSQVPGEHFDDDHLQVMTAVAGIASIALDNVRQWQHLRQENQDLRAESDLEHDMIGASPRMKEVFNFIRRVAPTDSTVLIEGESGTGKELVARAIHRNSPRSERPFVAINCAAIAETLLESELFGHEKGAFTGAVSQKKGKMEAAEGGTLLLDEVSELAPNLQAKLLRVLQEREFERVGGTRPIKLDIRLIAATNRLLPEAVQGGTFRKDLYYRLNVVAVTMPPLRDRREDIPSLTDHFIAKASRKCKARMKPLSAEARSYLINYDWPGNVRELENAIERALVLGSTESILPDDLPEALLEAGAPATESSAKYHGRVREVKKQLVLQALQQADSNYIEAAKALGMHPNSLLRLIRTLDLKAAVKLERGSSNQ